MPSELLKQLNEEQRAAATHDQGPLLIVAGAGTGKTTVLINRLAYLITEKKIKTDEILLLTFTEKAAGELEERADKILPYGYVDLWINTFHGFCERVLREFSLDIGLNPGFKLLNSTEQWVLIKKNLNRFNLDYYRPLGNPTKFISELLRHFSRLKDENISVAEYLKYAEELESDQDARLSGKKIGKKAKSLPKAGAEDDGEELEIGRIRELADAYHAYNQLLLENNFLDFGDLIVYALKLFKERSNILKFYRAKFKYIMVDEFQDTNWAQYELVKILVAPKNNLVVVGDDDQCLPGETLILAKTGRKKIKDIKTGDEVATAVGKGSLSYSRVGHVNKTKKTALLLSFVTKSGKKITATDNHKMFCFMPRISGKEYFYVYLMFKQELGWRLGMTNDLALRLRLERSADNIIAVGCYQTMAEARHQEVLLSLKYGIPTVCFQERDGIMDKKIWSSKLYKELDVAAGVHRLAQDLNIDLEASPYCLEAVNRGNKLRIKIHLEMCYRKYHSKVAKDGFLINPVVAHLLSIDTSDQLTIFKLEKMGFKINPGQIGRRLRLTSPDLSYLGKIARRVQKEIGGFIEPQMKIGKVKEKFLKAIIVPAKNIFPGMSLPIVTDGGVIYDQIVSRQASRRTGYVYDLEVNRTHNFVANGILVHNSIYKFRGASLSNIMQFKDDYPRAEEIILTANYRSRQTILDYAYRFIQNNNPNRLETKLKIDKKLVAQGEINKMKSAGSAVKFLNFESAHDELSYVARRITELHEADNGQEAGAGETNWSDFAILVRANDTAEAYVKELSRQNIPNQFMSWRGLYYKPIILDILAFFRLLDNYHESAALFRVLNMEIFKVAHLDLVNINKTAARKVWSLYEALKNINAISGVSPESIKNINKLLALVEEFSKMAATAKPTKIFLRFAYDSGLLVGLDHDRDLELFSFLNQLYQKIKTMEETEPDLRLGDFLSAINMELEAGETGSLKLDFADSDTVKIMTIHGAKGLEFKYVFIVNLVDKKFPTIARGEKIAIPDALVREKLAEASDAHLEEERRLFYVAVTRAKAELYLTGAKDYGGAREKKPSRFISEMGLASEIGPELTLSEKNEFLRDLHYLNARELTPLEKSAADKYPLPDKFSFSQLAAYSTCPLQYKYAFILKIPASADKASLVFGRVLHNTLYNFLLPFLSERKILQGDLFAGPGAAAGKDAPGKTGANLLSEARLMELYAEFWQADGYASKEEREKYQIKGRDALKKFLVAYQAAPNGTEILFLEKKFSFKIGDDVIKGAIDRVDKLGDGTLEVIDYKTGKNRTKLGFKDKRQLILYQLFLEEFLGEKVSALSYYYLESGEKISFLATAKDITKLRVSVMEEITAIKKRNFTPTPSPMCQFCDFNSICEFREV